MNKLFISACLILSLCGCKKSQSGSGDARKLIGKWKWVSSCGGIAGICYYAKDTPDSLIQTIEFTKDNQYLVYLNNRLTEKYSYESFPSESPYNHFPQYIVISNLQQEIGFRFADKNTLELLGGCCDMFDSEYKRVK